MPTVYRPRTCGENLVRLRRLAHRLGNVGHQIVDAFRARLAHRVLQRRLGVR